MHHRDSSVLIITITVMTWLWHHLSHFLVWVIAFYILHAHQMLTASKIWNIASTWRSGSTLHLRLMLWAEMSFLASSSLFHISPRQAPFTWTFTEAVQFKRGAQGQNIGIVTQVMSHCSLWSSLYTTLQRHTTAVLSTIFNSRRDKETEQRIRQKTKKKQKTKVIEMRRQEQKWKSREEKGKWRTDSYNISQSHLPLWSQHCLHHYLSIQVRPAHCWLTLSLS